MSQRAPPEVLGSEDLGTASEVLTALCLTADPTDQEIKAAARRLDPEAPGDAVEAIRVVIDAVRGRAS